MKRFLIVSMMLLVFSVAGALPAAAQDIKAEAAQAEVLVNLNTASLEELQTLSGVGKVTAQRIVDFRESNGPFADVADIQKVKGIGPVTFEKISPRITVEK